MSSLPADHPWRSLATEYAGSHQPRRPFRIIQEALSYQDPEHSEFKPVPHIPQAEVRALHDFDKRYGDTRYHDPVSTELGRQLATNLGAELMKSSIRNPEDLVRVIHKAKAYTTDKAMKAWFRDHDQPNTSNGTYDDLELFRRSGVAA